MSSQHLAEGASEQASSLEEMSSMTKQNADNANQAKAMMTEAEAVVPAYASVGEPAKPGW